MKKPSRKFLALAITGLLLFGFTMCCSGVHFPFISPRGTLEGHLQEDFGIGLPASTVVDNAYRVALRDPERVFGFHMTPADMGPFIAKLKAAGVAKGYQSQEDPEIKPLYGKPAWWNSPPMVDAEMYEVLIKDTSGVDKSSYGLLYSPSTGRAYLTWGEY